MQKAPTGAFCITLDLYQATTSLRGFVFYVWLKTGFTGYL